MREVFGWLTDDWAWVLVNILLPILLPVFGLALMRICMKKPVDRNERKKALRSRRYVLLFKDGQLGWVALLMCFASISDFADGLVRLHKAPPGWTIVVLLVIIGATMAATTFATNGAVDSVEPIDAKSFTNWISYYAVALCSALTTIAAGAAFMVIHFWLIRP
jgi:hypothetical protein